MSRGGPRKWSELERKKHRERPEDYPPPAGVPGLVRDVACPTCGAEPFQACRSAELAGERSRALPAKLSHPRRFNALTEAQRAAGWWGGNRS